MSELSKKLYILELGHIFKNYRILFMLTTISFLTGFILLWWQIWLIFGVILYIILLVYFSKGFRHLLNIHSVAVTLIVLYALPSSILILQDRIRLDSGERLTIFSAITIGLIGYTVGVLFSRIFFRFKKKENSQLSRKLNYLFWLTYKYRFLLSFICCAVLLYRGFQPMGMSYGESVAYRMEMPGFTQYFNSLVFGVFSVSIVVMISIIGDVKRYKKLSWLSYLLIGFVILLIVGGNRGIAISLFACLLLTFQPYLKRRHVLLILILSFIMVFAISGGIRYARTGTTFEEKIKNLYEYFSQVKRFESLFWGFSDFTTPFSTFITFVKNIPKNIPFDYGAYLKDFSLLIPTIVWPDRPLPYNVWYVKTFAPEVFARGGGFTFNVLGFGYLFAGLIGVFIHLFLYGLLFEWLNKFFRMIGDAAGLFLYSNFFIGLISFVVGCGFAVFIKNSLILNFLIPIFLLFLFTAFFDLLSPKRAKGPK